ncbi:SMI1/KNR4 family protein [Moheibacter lacus]|uniref:SMI1/KNR4 family protein n=1 Tax=Moheibacter lacus TaxID=2745851 RepID=A0A838ZUA7_9FLAO|nr:SMI1/KNR4 family protein [Moheibacter lacus]MBA5630541.1 SMI1/KNR4 family protein [Moheibacter lacus]
MSNIYREYFETLKNYLLILKIDANKEICGCNDDEIKKLESEKGKIPLAYEEYLRSIGKKFLFQFMDAENMAFEDLEYINEFADEVFTNNSQKFEKSIFVISERRNDYISLIYADEENPKVWIMSEYWDEENGENLSLRTSSLTDLMNVFFEQTLRNHPFSFHFVSEEVVDTKKHIKDLYTDWFNNILKVKQYIEDTKYSTHENSLIVHLNYILLDYYELNRSEINKILNPEQYIPNQTESIDNETTKKDNIIQRVLKMFK